MAEIIELDEALAELGRARAGAEDDDLRKCDVKAMVFGDPVPPRRIGRFIDLGLLGQGAMGTVRRAYDERLTREVAVKLVRHGSVPQHHDRLLREAQALAQLSHPNVVQIYEVGELDGEIFIAMELIEGTTLHDWQREPRAWRECLDVYLQAGRGLEAAHAAGLVHRDFKPTNCIRDEGGRVRVLDFGLARAIGFVEPPSSTPREPEELAAIQASPDANTSPGADGSLLQAQLTERGAIVGTFAYMAPEQLAKRGASAKSDQFSFCVALFEALYGTHPFSPDPLSALKAMVKGHPVPLADPESTRGPRALRRAIARGLSIDPDARWPSMEALLDELGRLGARRRATWAAVGAASFMLAAAAWWASSFEESAAAPCHDAAGDTAEVWSDERRGQVEQALRTASRDYGGQAWRTVDEALDGHVQGLTSGYTEACEATMVRSEATLTDRELRNTCLDQQRADVESTIAMLADADAVVTENAVELVGALRPHQECDDLDVLRLSTEREDYETATIERVRERLGVARRHRVTGKYEDGLRAVETLLEQVPDLEGSLLAEIHVVEGALRADLQQHQRAAELLKHALQDALRTNNETIAIDALIPLIYVVGIDQESEREALALGLVAESLTQRRTGPARARAGVLEAQAQVLTRNGEHELAEQKLRRALDILEGSVGRDDIALADPLDSLAIALRKQGALQEANRASRRALEIRIDLLGEHHPDVIHQYINLGATFQGLEDYVLARRHYERARELLLDMHSPPRELLAHMRTNLGGLLAKQQRWEEAEPLLRRGIDDWASVYGKRHPRVADARMGLGRLLHRRSRYAEALAELRVALEIYEEQELTGEFERRLAVTRQWLEKAREAMASPEG